MESRSLAEVLEEKIPGSSVDGEAWKSLVEWLSTVQPSDLPAGINPAPFLHFFEARLMDSVGKFRILAPAGTAVGSVEGVVREYLVGLGYVPDDKLQGGRDDFFRVYSKGPHAIYAYGSGYDLRYCREILLTLGELSGDAAPIHC